MQKSVNITNVNALYCVLFSAVSIAWLKMPNDQHKQSVDIWKKIFFLIYKFYKKFIKFI